MLQRDIRKHGFLQNGRRNSYQTYWLQRRRRRSGWSGQGRITFQEVVGLISRLQRRSANEMVGPGVLRKLAFARRVGVCRINCSRCFVSRSCKSPAWPDRTAYIGTHVLLNTHAHTTCSCYIVIRRISLLAVVPLLSLALRVGLMRRLPTSSCPFPFPKKPLTAVLYHLHITYCKPPHPLLAHAQVIFYVQWIDHF